MKASKDYRFMLGIMGMLGGGKQFKEIEAYTEEQAKLRNK